MKQVLLEARKRAGKGRSVAKKARKEGFIPAVIYGKGFETQNIDVPEKDFSKGLSSHGNNALFNVKIADDSITAMASEIQREPVSKKIFHVDFHKISLDKPVQTNVPVKLEGESKGVKMGGILEQVMWEIEVETLPLNIPEHITVDISSLEIDSEIRVKDIKPIDGLTFISDLDEVVAIISARREEASEPTELFSDVTAEPELIKKGKEDQE